MGAEALVNAIITKRDGTPRNGLVALTLRRALEGKPLTAEDIKPKLWEMYLRKELTRARVLTQADYDVRGGVIHTLEQDSPFQPGDYIAIGVAGEEYPITQKTVDTTKKMVSEPDEDGWAYYRSTVPVRAARIRRPFAVDRVGTDGKRYRNHGKAGDYFVDSGKRQYIVDGNIFTTSYESLPKDKI